MLDCMWSTRALLISWTLMLGISLVSSAHYNDEESLRTFLFTTNSYQYKIRPDTTVTVNLRLNLLTINQLDVPSQRLSFSGWLTIKWTDSRLTWTAATYNGILDFYDTELVLWRPLIIVDNSVANLGVLESDKLLIRATNLGEMTWEPPGIFETHCDVEITFYPFDTQTCVVEVTSWAYTLNEVDLQALDSVVSLEEFELSGEWDILSTWTERRILVDGTDQHSQIDFFIKLRRKPGYYITTILIPVIVTSLLCVLVFLLPSESGEKVGYSLTILLTYTVMLTLVASYMPPTSKSTSVLSVYLTIILFVGVFSTYLTVMVLYCHHREEDRPIPKWLILFTTSFMIPISCWRPAKNPDNENDHDVTVSTVTNGSSNGEDRNNRSNSKIRPHEIRDVYEGFHSTERFSKTRSNVRVGDGVDSGNKRYSHSPGSSNDADDKKRIHRNGSMETYEANDLKWADIAVILDKVCFRILGTFVALLTVVVCLVLIIGGYTA